MYLIHISGKCAVSTANKIIGVYLMHVRNFHVTATNDKGTKVSTLGTTLNIHVQQRDHGEPTTAIRIYGFVHSNGLLNLRVEDWMGNTIHTFVTER